MSSRDADDMREEVLPLWMEERINVICDQFEAAWDANQHPATLGCAEHSELAGCPAAQRRLLIELVIIDMERRWRAAREESVDPAEESAGSALDVNAPTGSIFPPRPRLADYVSKCPLLGAISKLPVELVLAEYRVRRRYHDQPQRQEYIRQFPELSHLAEALDQVDAEFHALGDKENRRQATDTKLGVWIANETLARSALLAENDDDDQMSGAAANPARLGRYDILRVIGRGRFGAVYLGKDRVLDREVALKVPHANCLDAPAALERFLQEARLSASLDHRGIVRIFDICRESSGLFIVLEHIDGCDLAELLESQRLPVLRAAELLLEIADAIGHAHQHGLVHRDLKPTNILVDQRGRPHVADFGLAVHEDMRWRHQGEISGTPAYMSPEQSRGETHRTDGRTDIWALGVIMYEMLGGRRPFDATDMTTLFEEIQQRNPRPLHEIDSSIPAELERICFKCLAKRVRDRYSTAADLRDDIQLWREQAPASSAVPLGQSPSHALDVRAVSKGLRSFEAEDASFFLHLLPGPRDRLGQPDVIRFWKNRIESDVADPALSVGVIYGPSGCGKSSLVKAGLLPSLSADRVAPVYVEATATDTESCIARELRKLHAQLPDGQQLHEQLASLSQRDTGRKTLIVIDQLEQWLYPRRDTRGCELVRALRHCDGRNVQCLLLVRDDFWMGTTRLMKELEIEPTQQHFWAVDTFNLRHARRVLHLFGAAFGALPESTDSLTEDQRQFLDNAVNGLSQEAQVVPVRLALFCTMLKSRPWTRRTLQSLGGVDEIGIRFLESTFSSSTANPQHRLHERAARCVLGKLLPETDADIKGHCCLYADLLRASGYGDRTAAFEQLIRILDRELRLITPIDMNENAQSQLPDDASGHEVGFQLTHDYLVSPVRNWLTRKQRGTWRGRAALCLADRCSQWQRVPTRRYLPSPLEYLSIVSGVPKKSQTRAERSMMRAAGRRYSSFTIAALILGLVAYWVGWQIHGRTAAGHLLKTICAAKLEEVPALVEHELPRVRRWVNPHLSHLAEQPDDFGKQIRANLALLPVDTKRLHFLSDAMLSCNAEDFGVILDSLAQHSGSLTGQLWDVFQDETRPPGWRFNAGMALAAYDGSSESWTKRNCAFLAQQMLSSAPEDQPLLRSHLAPISSRLLPEIRLQFRNLSAVEDVREGAALALAEFGVDEDKLAGLISTSTAGQYRGLVKVVKSVKGDRLRQDLCKIVSEEPSELSESDRIVLGKRRSAAAIALMDMGHVDDAIAVLDVKPAPEPKHDLEALTQFVHGLRDRGIGPAVVVKALREVDHSRTSVLYGLTLALGEFDVDEIPREELPSLLTELSGRYRDDPRSAVHGATGWLLRRWGHADVVSDVDRTPTRYDEIGEREWIVRKIGDLHMTFVVIPSGTFVMGSPEWERNRKDDETPHQVTVSRFAISDREVSRGQYEAFLGRTMHEIDTWSPTSEHPAFGQDWYDAVRFCRWLTLEAGLEDSQQCYQDPGELQDAVRLGQSRSVDWPVRLDVSGFRLPTESEWEYACRAGTITAFSFGSDRSLLRHYAWYWVNSSEKPLQALRFRPNYRGLFDMHGSASEWCHDAMKTSYVPGPLDPIGPEKTYFQRRRRGGSRNEAHRNYRDLRSAGRANSPADQTEISSRGFRVVFRLPNDVR